MFNEKIWISKFWIFCTAFTKENHYFLVFNVAPAFNPGYKWNRNSNKITSLKSITSEITPHNYRPIKLTLPTKWKCWRKPKYFNSIHQFADVNECETGQHNCEAYEFCNNTEIEGSFSCSCKANYSGNGPNGAGKLNLQLFDSAHVIKPTRGLDKRDGGLWLPPQIQGLKMAHFSPSLGSIFDFGEEGVCVWGGGGLCFTLSTWTWDPQSWTKYTEAIKDSQP